MPVETDQQIRDELGNPNTTIKGLSLWQPWATLMALGQKQYETRPGRMKYRGWVLIKATQTSPTWAMALLSRDPFAMALRGRHLPHGEALCLVRVVDCIATEEVTRMEVNANLYESYLISDKEWDYGDYGPKRFVYITDKTVRLLRPFPSKGRQGYGDITPSDRDHIMDAMYRDEFHIIDREAKNV